MREPPYEALTRHQHVLAIYKKKDNLISCCLKLISQPWLKLNILYNILTVMYITLH